MSRRLIDLSIPLENEVLSDPAPFTPKIHYIDHKTSVAQLCAFFPGLKPEDLPDGEAWALEKIELITHNGTHLDAPYHFASTMNEGERALTIDEVPLEWCFRPGVKLDFRQLPDGHVVTAAEVEAELDRISYRLQPLDIVVINTRAGTAYGQPDYVNAGCGMGAEATLYLLERGVRLTGTD
ncbi:MAG TPA: cyclase family protein, partial [Saprospiraceae bacterium]|nr:cyclase family protein [Saprospiraceae bacterium]